MTNNKSYITSDLHLFHQRIIKYAERIDYEDTESDTKRMSYDIVTHINKAVPDSPGIVLWNLGDVFYGPMTSDKSFDELRHIISIMKGNYRRLKLVLGNHDKQFKELYLHHAKDFHWIENNDTTVEIFRKLGFDDVYDYPVLNGKFIFSHEPVFLKNSEFLNIHGHTHQMFVDENYFTWEIENHDMVKKAFSDFDHPSLANIDFDKKWKDWEEYVVNPHKYINACWDAMHSHHILEMTSMSDGCVDVDGLQIKDNRL